MRVLTQQSNLQIIEIKNKQNNAKTPLVSQTHKPSNAFLASTLKIPWRFHLVFFKQEVVANQNFVRTRIKTS